MPSLAAVPRLITALDSRPLNERSALRDHAVTARENFHADRDVLLMSAAGLTLSLSSERLNRARGVGQPT